MKVHTLTAANDVQGEWQRCQNTRSPLERTVNEKEIREKPISWDDTGLVMFLDGGAYTTLYDKAGQDIHIYLGREEDVKAILAGQKPITEAKGTKQQMALSPEPSSKSKPCLS